MKKPFHSWKWPIGKTNKNEFQISVKKCVKCWNETEREQAENTVQENALNGNTAWFNLILETKLALLEGCIATYLYSQKTVKASQGTQASM